MHHTGGEGLGQLMDVACKWTVWEIIQQHLVSSSHHCTRIATRILRQNISLRFHCGDYQWMTADNYVTAWKWLLCTYVCMKHLLVFLYTEIYFKWYVLTCTNMWYIVYKMPYQTNESNYNSVIKFITNNNHSVLRTNKYVLMIDGVCISQSNTFSLFH